MLTVHVRLLCVAAVCFIITSCEQNEEFLLETFSCPTEISDVEAVPYHIILIAGQSNTHSGIGLDPSKDMAPGEIIQLGRFQGNDYELIPANEPLDHHSFKENHIGFGLTFAKLYRAHYTQPQDTLILVPCGKAGSGFIDDQWDPGSPLYKDAVARVRHLKQVYPQSKVQAVLWHQGERDLDNTTYSLELNHFINQLRIDIRQPNVPFILGGLAPEWVQADLRRLAQQNRIKEVASFTERTGFADPTIPFIIRRTNRTQDAIHYDAPGQRELGKRYFTEFTCLVE